MVPACGRVCQPAGSGGEPHGLRRALPPLTSAAVLITEILDAFAKLVFKRLLVKAETDDDGTGARGKLPDGALGPHVFSVFGIGVCETD